MPPLPTPRYPIVTAVLPSLQLPLLSTMSTHTLDLTPLCVLALAPLRPCPHTLPPLSGLCLCRPCPSLPPVTRTTIAAIVNHHQFFCTVANNDHRNPFDGASHRGRQWRSLLSAAAVDGCGSGGIFATAINNNNWSYTLSSIPPSPLSMTTIVDKDRHHRRCYQLLPQPTLTIIQ